MKLSIAVINIILLFVLILFRIIQFVNMSVSCYDYNIICLVKQNLVNSPQGTSHITQTCAVLSRLSDPVNHVNLPDCVHTSLSLC